MSTALQLTLEQYDRMIERGDFDEVGDKRIELINGEIREMSPPGPNHEDVIDELTDWSTGKTLRDRVRVRIQNSIGIPPSASAPQPDVAWIVQKRYWGRRPLPEDVLLVIEVSDSSVGVDRHIKGPLYAEAGIAEYWIVNIPSRSVEVHRNPVNGSYRDIKTYGIDETVRPLACPEVELPVATLFAG